MELIVYNIKNTDFDIANKLVKYLSFIAKRAFWWKITCKYPKIFWGSDPGARTTDTACSVALRATSSPRSRHAPHGNGSLHSLLGPGDFKCC